MNDFNPFKATLNPPDQYYELVPVDATGQSSEHALTPTTPTGTTILYTILEPMQTATAAQLVSPVKLSSPTQPSVSQPLQAPLSPTSSLHSSVSEIDQRSQRCKQQMQLQKKPQIRQLQQDQQIHHQPNRTSLLPNSQSTKHGNNKSHHFGRVTYSKMHKRGGLSPEQVSRPDSVTVTKQTALTNQKRPSTLNLNKGGAPRPIPVITKISRNNSTFKHHTSGHIIKQTTQKHIRHSGPSTHHRSVLATSPTTRVSPQQHTHRTSPTSPHMPSPMQPASPPLASTQSSIGPMRTSKKASPARNHKCHICDKTFVRPAELQRHVRKHTGERPFKCSECDMSFMRKDHLTSHQLKHRDEKQFKCQYCDYESNRGDTLKRHCNNKHKNELMQMLPSDIDLSLP